MWAALVNVIIQTCRVLHRGEQAYPYSFFPSFFLVVAFADEQPRSATDLSPLRIPGVADWILCLSTVLPPRWEHITQKQETEPCPSLLLSSLRRGWLVQSDSTAAPKGARWCWGTPVELTPLGQTLHKVAMMGGSWPWGPPSIPEVFLNHRQRERSWLSASIAVLLWFF